MNDRDQSNYFLSQENLLASVFHGNQTFPSPLKGTGTRDLIWLKVLSLDRSWLVGLTDDLKKNLKCCFIFFINILKS